MKTFRFWWWLVSAFIKKHGRIILLASVISALLISIAPRVIASIPKRASTSRIGLIGRFKINELPDQITKKISDGLTTVDRTGIAVPALSLGWDVSEDGKTYLFRLDPNRTWHDGTTLRSDDIRLPLENLETEIVDEQTVAFHLKEPFAPFPTALSRPLFKSTLVGTGEWKVASLKRNGEFVDHISLVDQHRSQLIYRFYRTTADLITALKLGEIDQTDELTSPKDIPPWNQLSVVPTLHLDRYVAVFFNNQDANLSEKSFRQALTYAIPNKPQGEERALGPINPESWAYNPQVKPYYTDIKQAKELLDSSFTDKEIPSVELTTFLPYLDHAEDIAKSWRSIGVRTTVKVATSAPSEFQALLIGQQIPSDPDQYVLWHSTQQTNLTRYSSPKVDKLLEDGRKTTDQKKRVEIYRDFQRFLLEDSPAAFLQHMTTYRVVKTSS